MSDWSRGDADATAVRTGRSMVAGASILGLALVCVGIITLSPSTESARLPFWCLRCGSRPAIDVLLNVLMFVPIGAGLALLGTRARWALAIIVLATLSVEALQLTVVPGRFASARDIIANTLGGIIGWHLAMRRPSLLRPSAGRARALALGAALIWVASQAFTAWAMTVIVPSPPWWAQIRLRDLGFPEVFRGDVVRLSLGTVPILYSDQLEESADVRRQLLAGAPMRVVVTGVESRAGPAPILLLAANDELSEVSGIVQTGTDAFFRIRTRAATLGLRNPAIRLADVFPPGASRDTIAVTARRAGGRYAIESDRAGVHLERTLAVSPSWAWALLMPIPHYSFGSEVRVLTAAWLFVVLGITGFWAAQHRPPLGLARRDDRWIAGTLIVVIATGLAVAPVAFGVPVAHWSEWLAAMAGAAVGVRAGQRVGRIAERLLP